MPATEKERFDLLFEMLKRYYEALFEGTLKSAGVLLVLGGWAASSKTLQWHLCNERSLRIAVLILSLVGLILYLVTAGRIYYLSRSTACLLDRVDYMEAEMYSNYRLRWFTVAVWCVAFLGLVAALDLVLIAVSAPPCIPPA